MTVMDVSPITNEMILLEDILPITTATIHRMIPHKPLCFNLIILNRVSLPFPLDFVKREEIWAYFFLYQLPSSEELAMLATLVSS